MTIIQTPSTGSSDRFAFGQNIYREDIQELVEMHNWVAGQRPIQHLALSVGPPGSSDFYSPLPVLFTHLVGPASETGHHWGSSGQERGTLWVSESQGFADDLNNLTWIVSDIYVSENAMTGVCGGVGQVYDGAGYGARADFIFTGSVGLVTASLNFTPTSNDGRELTKLVNWNQVGRGWVQFKLDFTINGSTPSAYLRQIRVEDMPVTSSVEMTNRYPATGSLTT